MNPGPYNMAHIILAYNMFHSQKIINDGHVLN